MRHSPEASHPETTALSKRRSFFRRFLRDDKGSAAIEFGILAIPFFLVIFASAETFLAFTGEQLLANATDTMARKIRTGEITSAMSAKDFRKAFCAEIAIMMPCSASELEKPSKLFIDVRSFTNFNSIPVTVPRVGNASTGALDTSGFRFAPGGPRSVNIVRAYYRWEVVTDLARPYVSNLRPAGSGPSTEYLMVATDTFQNENY